jgi:hypothetical protein
VLELVDEHSNWVELVVLICFHVARLCEVTDVGVSRLGTVLGEGAGGACIAMRKDSPVCSGPTGTVSDAGQRRRGEAGAPCVGVD